MTKQYKLGAQILSNSEALAIMEQGGLIFMGYGPTPDRLYTIKDNRLKYFCYGIWSDSFTVMPNFMDATKFVAESCEWFDSIPSHGVLCRVWDNFKSDSIIQIVHEYDEDMTYKFKTAHEGYKNAEPLSKEEITQYFIGE